MGEKSRLKGILGENIAEGFFNLIGWKPISDRDVLCVQKQKHKCKTHGIDMFFSHTSPLETDVADVIVCSVKYLASVNKGEILNFIEKLDNSANCSQNDILYNRVVAIG